MKFNVKINLYENGSAVIVKKKSEVIGAKVFEGIDAYERQQKWLESLAETE